jgi:uncharacterized protein YjbI with pentapeptide repeats
MANPDHVAQIKKGVAAWNEWRDEDPDIRPDLSEVRLYEAKLMEAKFSKADLSLAYLPKANLYKAILNRANLYKAILNRANLLSANLSGANLNGADLRDAKLSGANLREARLREANLSGADLYEATLSGADLREADLSGTNLNGANLNGAILAEANLAKATLSEANLSEANLSQATLVGANLREVNLREAVLNNVNLNGANLRGVDLFLASLEAATLVETDLTDADLTGCRIYGVSAWGVKLDGAKQQNLIITPENEPEITVDNIEVAQFVYLLLHNEKIRDVIDTIGKKGVLLLGRFTEGRIEILERLRTKLRELGFVPIVFNFDKPETKDFTETVRLLANLSHFVIVDITNPRSAPLELQAAVPDYMVPFVPILQEGQAPFAMFVDLQNKYDWVLKPVIAYPSVDRLIEVLEEKIVEPAKAKFNQLLTRRTEQLRIEKV